MIVFLIIYVLILCGREKIIKSVWGRGWLKFILMHACMNVDAIVAMIAINKALSVTNVATLNQIQILEQKFVPNHCEDLSWQI